MCILLSDILLDERDNELERCISKIIELQGKQKFWREVQGIESGKYFVFVFGWGREEYTFGFKVFS